MPCHISSMFNFLKCTAFLTGNKSKRCVAWKFGIPDVTVYMRKFRHGFMELVDTQSKEGVNCSNIKKHNMFVVSDDNKLYTYCSDCFSKINNVKVKMDTSAQKTQSKSTINYQIEILSMQVSKDERFLIVITGICLIKGFEDLH